MKNESAGIEFITLDASERERVAAWLDGMERVTTINLGRWVQLQDGSTDYLSVKELAELMDNCPPFGFALEIIMGQCVMSEYKGRRELIA